MTLSNFLRSILTILFLTAVAIPAAQAIDDADQDISKAKIEETIRSYLREHPEVVIEAITVWQKRQQLASMLPAIENYREFLERDDRTPVLGNPDGDVTLVEFFDYRCGFCRKHYGLINQLVKEDGNIRLIMKQFPILDREGVPPHSRLAAAAALAAHKQGKFEELHHAMMTSETAVTDSLILTLAARVGLDVLQLRTDMNSKQIQSSLDTSLYVGQDIGFSGTPAYVIGQDVIEGAASYEKMKKAIATARQQNKSLAQQKSGSGN